MARDSRPLSVLRALARANWRDLSSLRSIAGQNFILFVAFVALQPESAAFFVALLIAVLLFPLATDPMLRIPPDRRLAWPLTRSEWTAIRAAAFLLSPIAWIALLLLAKVGWRYAAVAVVAGALLTSLKAAVRRLPAGLASAWLRKVPAPPGLTGQLMRLHWREMLRSLDPYVALVLMLCTLLYKLTEKNLEPAANRILSLVVALAISTQAQTLFGLDRAGMERYRIFPLRGWRILLAKDLSFLCILVLLTLPLDIASALTGSLAVLAIGHHRSVLSPISQVPWRFTSGVLFPDGAFQTVSLFAIGSAVASFPVPLILLALLGWLGSLFFYGRQWDRQAQLGASV